MHYLYSSGVSGVDGVPLSDVLAFASGFFTFGAFAFLGRFLFLSFASATSVPRWNF